MPKVLPLTDVKTRFPQIVKGVETREEEVIVTRNGRPSAVILNYHEFLRLKETIDTLTDYHLLDQIHKSKQFFRKKKKGLTFEDIFNEQLTP